MIWPFKKRKAIDWRRTGASRWVEIKRQDEFAVERLQCEFIDMESGRREWRWDTIPMLGTDPCYYERFGRIGEMPPV